MSFEVIKYGDPIKGADDATESTVLATVAAITAQAKLLAPVDDGHLKNSIMWKVQKSKGGNEGEREIDVNPQKFEGYVGSAVSYSIYQEFGTKHTPAQPYLRPSVFVVESQKMKVEVTAENVNAMRKAMGAGRVRK